MRTHETTLVWEKRLVYFHRTSRTRAVTRWTYPNILYTFNISPFGKEIKKPHPRFFFNTLHFVYFVWVFCYCIFCFRGGVKNSFYLLSRLFLFVWRQFVYPWLVKLSVKCTRIKWKQWDNRGCAVCWFFLGFFFSGRWGVTENICRAIKWRILKWQWESDQFPRGLYRFLFIIYGGEGEIMYLWCLGCN